MSSPLQQVADTYRKLKENDAFGLALRPRTLANYRLWQKEQAERPIVMKSLPPFVEIELTNRCNLACIQCLRSLGLKPYTLGDITFDNYKKVLDQFPYIMNLSLNGFGEPFMHPQFFEIVDYTRKKHPHTKIGIYTNGMLIDEEKAYRLMDCGLTELNISIDAALPETYRKVRRGGKLDILHDNIKRLVKAKHETGAKLPLIGMNFVLLNENEGELVQFVEQAADFGVDFLNCVTYATYDWGFQNRRTHVNYERELSAARKRMAELNVRVKSFPSEDISWSDPRNGFGCQFFWGEEFRVSFEGEITLGCCTPFKESFTYGNLLEQPFREIWNNAYYREYRQMALDKRPPNAICASCDKHAKTFFTNREESTVAIIPMSALMDKTPSRL